MYPKSLTVDTDTQGTIRACVCAEPITHEEANLCNRVILESDSPTLATGYTVLVSSLLFLILGSYATLFSAFWPFTGFWVSLPMLCVVSKSTDLGRTVTGCLGSRYTLQVFCALTDTYYGVLCYCELGGVAILQKFLIYIYTMNRIYVTQEKVLC